LLPAATNDPHSIFECGLIENNRCSYKIKRVHVNKSSKHA